MEAESQYWAPHFFHLRPLIYDFIVCCCRSDRTQPSIQAAPNEERSSAMQMSVHSLALTDGLLERWWWRREEGAFLTLICCREVERKGRVCQRCEGLAEAGWFRSIHRTAIISFGFGYHVTVTGAGLSIPLNVCVCVRICVWVSSYVCFIHHIAFFLTIIACVGSVLLWMVLEKAYEAL